MISLVQWNWRSVSSLSLSQPDRDLNSEKSQTQTRITRLLPEWVWLHETRNHSNGSRFPRLLTAIALVVATVINSSMIYFWWLSTLIICSIYFILCYYSIPDLTQYAQFCPHCAHGCCTISCSKKSWRLRLQKQANHCTKQNNLSKRLSQWAS